MNLENDRKLLLETKEFIINKRSESFDDPFINPIASLAHDFSRKLISKDIDLNIINSLVENLTQELIINRSVNLKNHSSISLKGLVEKVSLSNKIISFNQFRKFWSDLKIGTVFTAHPTFNLNDTAWKYLVKLTNNKFTKSKPIINQKRINKITLTDEHRSAMRAIQFFWKARKLLCQEVLKYGKKIWPNDFEFFLPNIVCGATWVGYDLDGRTDINWIDSMIVRYEEKKLMLENLITQLEIIREKSYGEIKKSLKKLLEEIQFLSKKTKDNLKILNRKNINLEELNELENTLKKYKQNEVDPNYISQILSKISKIEKNVNLSIELCVLASEITNKGYGCGEIHIRFNALQLHNALRGTQEISTNSASVRTDLNKLSDLIENVGKEEVSFAAIMSEPTTAKRQLMFSALVLKYIDKSIPIRLLIAECEHPATILAAVYFAKKYGIDGLIDISPLFETAASIERGARIIEQALDCKPFFNTIKNRRRISIQTGFSDAGRFMGQVTSSLAVERLQVKLAEVFGKKLEKDIEIVIFNTHGESIGRGGHPNGVEERGKYLFSSFARNAFLRLGFNVKHETSFQGGDGYLRFGSFQLAKETLSSIISCELIPDNNEIDSFYEDSDYSLDFFITLKKWHENLFSNPDYWELLDSFSNNLLVNSGSRPSKRTSDFGNERSDPSKIRAISHNAILQQIGYLAHIAGGLGTAVNIDIEQFHKLQKSSKRFNQILDVGLKAKKLSSLNTPLAYSLILDQSYWVGRSYSNSEKSMREPFRKLSRALKNDKRSESIKRLIAMLRDDALDFNSIVSTNINLHPQKNERITLDILQSIRISLMAHALLLTAQLPSFSARDNLSPEKLLSTALKMDLNAVILQSKKAFPRAQLTNTNKIKNVAQSNDEYKKIQENYIDPIFRCHELILEIGVSISHAFNAHG